MYLPLCDICKNKNVPVHMIDSKTNMLVSFVCSERKKGCPGFKPKKVDE